MGINENAVPEWQWWGDPPYRSNAELLETEVAFVPTLATPSSRLRGREGEDRVKHSCRAEVCLIQPSRPDSGASIFAVHPLLRCSGGQRWAKLIRGRDGAGRELVESPSTPAPRPQMRTGLLRRTESWGVARQGDPVEEARETLLLATGKNVTVPPERSRNR